MNSPCKWALAGLLLSAVELSAQVVSSPPVPIPTFQQTFTTGMVGVTSTQTAQLNVLNLTQAPASTTTPAVACVVQLAFYDAQNRLLKQGPAATVASGDAVSLSLAHSDIPPTLVTVPRESIRGQVKTIPPPTPVGGTSSTVIVAGICQLFTTLEIYDSVSGVTQVFTSDTRPVASGGIVPLLLPGAPAAH